MLNNSAIETNLILNTSNLSDLPNFLKENRCHIDIQYKDIGEYYKNLNKFLLRDLKDKVCEDIDFAVFFPVVGSDSKIFAVTYQKSNMLYSKSIKDIEYFARMTKCFINKKFDIPLSLLNINGKYEINADENFYGDSYTLAVFLTILITNFGKVGAFPITVTGIFNDKFEIEPVNYVQEKYKVFDREILNSSRKFVYCSDVNLNYPDALRVDNTDEVLDAINFEYFFPEKFLKLKDLLKKADNLETEKRFFDANEIYLYVERVFNNKLDIYEKFKILLSKANFENLNDNISKAENFYHQIDNEIIKSKHFSPFACSDDMSKYYLRLTKFYLKKFEIDNAKNILEECKDIIDNDYEDKYYEILGNIYEIDFDFDKALHYYHKSEENGYMVDEARAFNNKMRLFIKMNEFKFAKKLINAYKTPPLNSENVYYILKYSLLNGDKDFFDLLRSYKFYNSKFDKLNMLILNKLNLCQLEIQDINHKFTNFICDLYEKFFDGMSLEEYLIEIKSNSLIEDILGLKEYILNFIENKKVLTFKELLSTTIYF
ncbi:hypothetical protein LF845_06560 [Deferribacterales bacterium Es71-Z0220]|uniref:tetratricopeptide repeat protein n=1 Tax=Deferrivibrio essentukiensis TaxID=2880922 RepID=UPI001F601357|nr:hypothetical protein [Deferrivibrio essentukiensis]MCB4204619.1 hypothetical protein [Deferrivibrio essentukiensis]